MELFIPIWLGFAIVTAIAANARGHSAGLWFVIGLLGGVFALLAVLVMRPGEASPTVGPTQLSWMQPKTSSPSGPEVANRKGIRIYQHGDGFWVMGQVFQSLPDAERHVDNTPRR